MNTTAKGNGGLVQPNGAVELPLLARVDRGPAVGPAPELDREIWLVDLTHTGRGPASDTVPLGIGFLSAYLQTKYTPLRQIRLFRYPDTFGPALDTAVRPPDLVGFSNYLWNFRLSRRFAGLIKRRWPETVVVFGGPNLPLPPAERDSFLRSLPEIDFYVAKEGEVAFAELVGLLDQAGWERNAVHGRVPSSTVSVLAS